MGCMKCGRDISSGQVFCDGCLEEMEKYPVKPGTVVRLPQRKSVPAAKKSNSRRRTQISPEEQVKNLKRILRNMVALVIILSLLLGAAGYFAVIHLLECDIVRLPGQNYSSVTDSETTEAE